MNDTKEQVLILNTKGDIIFQGKVSLTNRELDKQSGCVIADCHINNQKVLVWKIDEKWQGWIH